MVLRGEKVKLHNSHPSSLMVANLSPGSSPLVFWGVLILISMGVYVSHQPIFKCFIFRKKDLNTFFFFWSITFSSDCSLLRGKRSLGTGSVDFKPPRAGPKDYDVL